MDLTEFLLARVAEDEKVARAAIRQRGTEIAQDVYLKGHEPTPDMEGPSVWDDWTGGPGIRMGAERLRAECEAKRRIVQSVDGSLLAEYMRDESELGYDDALATMELVLCNLALPYADHPDYQSAWRA